MIGRSVDINVAKRKEGTHVVWNDIENATTRQELADKETCGSSNEHDDAPKSGQQPVWELIVKGLAKAEGRRKV